MPLLVITFLYFDFIATSFADDAEVARVTLENNCTKKVIEGTASLNDEKMKLYKAKAYYIEGDYQRSLSILESVENKRPEHLSLISEAAYKLNNHKIASNSLSLLMRVDSHHQWAKIKMAQYGFQEKKNVKYVCDNKKIDSALLLECVRLFSEDESLKKVYLERILAEQSQGDSYVPIYKAKSHELLGNYAQALKELQGVSRDSSAYSSAVRELMRIYADLGKYQHAKSHLSTLLELEPLNPINHIIAFDFYKKFHQPFLAYEHLSATSACTTGEWIERKPRSGYISGALGVPISKGSMFRFSIMNFLSYFRPHELVQNRAYGLDLNLYKFRSHLLNMGWEQEMGESSSLLLDFTYIDKEEPVSEKDYALRLGYRRLFKTPEWLISNTSQFVYTPVVAKSISGISRESYIISNQTDFFDDSGDMNWHLETKVGEERLLQANQVTRFFEIHPSVDFNIGSDKTKFNLGLRYKVNFSTPNIKRVQAYLGVDYELNSRMFVKVYNELFHVLDVNAQAWLSSLQIVTPLNEMANLKASISYESDITYSLYQQLILSTSIERRLPIRDFEIKAILEAGVIRNTGEVKSDFNFLNIKIGAPL